MKLIVISSGKKDENEIAVVNALFENGLPTFHLRKPRLSTKETEEYLMKIPKQFHKRIVIHSHHKLAAKYDLGGIHFTKTHLRDKNKTWFRLLRISWKKPLSSLILSASHSKLASVYDTDPHKYNYIFLSPIFDSLTGKYQSGFHEEGIRAANAKSGKKIIARGGVDHSRVEKIISLGFYGMALYSALWESKNPLEEYLKVVRRLDELNVAYD